MRLPDFIVAGAVKSGTTSLNYYLKQHPEIYMSPMKEPRFFAYDATDPEHQQGEGLRFPIRTLEEYGQLFDGVDGETAVGEASPHYMISPVAPRQIRTILPDVRLIFSLRDPVKRAYSVYWHAVRLGQEDRPPGEAFTEEDYRVRNGRYYELLQPWYDLFPASQIKVILFEDLVADTLGIYGELCHFISVGDCFEPDTIVRNRGGAYKNKRLGLFMERVKTHPLKRSVVPYLPGPIRNRLADVRDSNLGATPPMPPEVADWLYEYYREDTARLQNLLQRDLAAWRRLD